jgi:hypothetical protein
MQRLLRMLAVGLLPVVLAGCVESVEVITLNPDGSGKSEFDVIPPDALSAFSSFADTSEAVFGDSTSVEAGRLFLQELIDRAHGVEAWSDLSWEEEEEDGRLHVKGVAYFRDVEAFDLENLASIPVRWYRKGPAMILDLAPPDTTKPKQKPPRKTPISDAEIERAIKKARASWPQEKMALGLVLGTLKVDKVYVLPGRRTEFNGFQDSPEGLRLHMDGQRMVAIKEKLLADDAAMRKILRSGHTLDEGLSDPSLYPQLFGAEGEVRARFVPPMEEIFEYDEEVEEAKEDMPEMFEELGLTPVEKSDSEDDTDERDDR